ncbi:Response regulator receiver domain-containing protein [Arthrobacter sp. VKM Ac-2550]|nr:Response regulator receiver domain-containing protein [Arthrobacter sp. VKM Ac-2550]
MDLQMGAGMDGVTATARIRANGDAGRPAPPVLILTTYDTDADILAAGADPRGRPDRRGQQAPDHPPGLTAG